jgi:ribosomal protein S10
MKSHYKTYYKSRALINQPQNQRGQSQLVLRFRSSIKKDVIKSASLTCALISELGGTLNARYNTIYEQKNYVLNRDHQNRAHADFNSALIAALDISKHQSMVQSSALFTVIRSPFVFKKTREQFGLNLYCCDIDLSLSLNQQAFILRSLSQLALPGELKIISNV